MIWIARAADGPPGAPGDHQMVMETESPKNRAVWRIPGLVVLAAVAVGGFAIAASARHIEVSDHTASYPARDRLQLDSHSGDIVVHGQDRADIQVHSRIRSTSRTSRLTADTNNGRLRLGASCHHSFLNWDTGDDAFGIGPLCAVGYTIATPAATSLSVQSGTGDVRADGISSPSVLIDSGTGDIVLDFVAAPRDVQIDSGTGDVTVRVPGGSYNINTDAGIGSVRLGLGIVSDPASPNRVRIDSGTGDVTVERSDV
jgi:DUF4097 and DUF4098 domain-containing protein YvlB